MLNVKNSLAYTFDAFLGTVCEACGPKGSRLKINITDIVYA